jgi:hypothetical protein
MSAKVVKAVKAVIEQLEQNENLVSVNADVCNFWEKDVMPMLFCRSWRFFLKQKKLQLK